MLGALAGDLIGSVYEFDDNKPPYDFPLFSKDSQFTDDSILTIALADSIIHNIDYKLKLKEYFRLYPGIGYGGNFYKWAMSDSMEPYNSYGNGSAMRVSPVGWAYNSLGQVLEAAKQSAMPTHNHPEGIKGAQATASAIYLLRKGITKDELKTYIETTFKYDLDLDYDELIDTYGFDETCQRTVPQAIYTFLISQDFEDSIRRAICIGGDSDTVTCINGSIAEAAYGVPRHIENEIYKRLDEPLFNTVELFYEKMKVK
jgi:ADP-ribosylglycohydrolase